MGNCSIPVLIATCVEHLSKRLSLAFGITRLTRDFALMSEFVLLHIEKKNQNITDIAFGVSLRTGRYLFLAMFSFFSAISDFSTLLLISADMDLLFWRVSTKLGSSSMLPRIQYKQCVKDSGKHYGHSHSCVIWLWGVCVCQNSPPSTPTLGKGGQELSTFC